MGGRSMRGRARPVGARGSVLIRPARHTVPNTKGWNAMARWHPWPLAWQQCSHEPPWGRSSPGPDAVGGSLQSPSTQPEAAMPAATTTGSSLESGPAVSAITIRPWNRISSAIEAARHRRVGRKRRFMSDCRFFERWRNPSTPPLRKRGGGVDPCERGRLPCARPTVEYAGSRVTTPSGSRASLLNRTAAMRSNSAQAVASLRPGSQRGGIPCPFRVHPRSSAIFQRLSLFSSRLRVHPLPLLFAGPPDLRRTRPR